MSSIWCSTQADNMWVENTSSTSLHSTMISRPAETEERGGPGGGTTPYLTFQTQHNEIFYCLKNLRIYERFGKSMFFIGKNLNFEPIGNSAYHRNFGHREGL